MRLMGDAMDCLLPGSVGGINHTEMTLRMGRWRKRSASLCREISLCDGNGSG